MTRKNILIIDDDPIIHVACEMMLFGTSYKKISIYDPDIAMMYKLNKSRFDIPDLIVVDYMLGKISGIDVIRSIREDPSFGKTPIILFTGFPDEVALEKEPLDELNIAETLFKPVSKEKFLSSIDRLIR